MTLLLNTGNDSNGMNPSWDPALLHWSILRAEVRLWQLLFLLLFLPRWGNTLPPVVTESHTENDGPIEALIIIRELFQWGYKICLKREITWVTPVKWGQMPLKISLHLDLWPCQCYLQGDLPSLKKVVLACAPHLCRNHPTISHLPSALWVKYLFYSTMKSCHSLWMCQKLFLSGKLLMMHFCSYSRMK